MQDCCSIILSYIRCKKCKHLAIKKSDLCFFHFMMEKYPQIFSHYNQYVHGVKVGKDTKTLEKKMIKYAKDSQEILYNQLMIKCVEKIS